MKYERPILVWRFYDAPEGWQNLSPHGGDEDWLAYVPDEVEPPFWMESGASQFGVCDVSTHKVEGGTIHIGAHA